jgi:hypothetical protein
MTGPRAGQKSGKVALPREVPERSIRRGPLSLLPGLSGQTRHWKTAGERIETMIYKTVPGGWGAYSPFPAAII